MNEIERFIIDGIRETLEEKEKFEKEYDDTRRRIEEFREAMMKRGERRLLTQAKRGLLT
ncbi:hypothetical protein G3578_09995 [Brevibacillus sp. SYP-B805]|uniref:hypothetical protein n=1 Tax=Brevibacillus sp. SYP-B805 TaxID=1578199 RepID=UPI0013ECDAA0|nr:hypothetical protein [Brevibacillus sp. SYP-B805]NGQ95483.1 hypothetical protein [Brevibacillus sp. SYP-B805]